MKKVFSITLVIAMSLMLISGLSITGYALEKKVSAAVESEADYCEDEHTFGEWIHVKDATKDSDGLNIRKCQACSEEETEEYDFTSIPYHVNGGSIYFNGETGIIESSDYEVEKVDIPEKIDGVNVTGIDSYAFSDHEDLVSVDLSNGIKTIGEGSFSSCISLKDINIPGTVKKIGESCFYGCTELKRLEIPECVTHIGVMAFVDCSEDCIIYLTKDSYAEKYCQEYDVLYIADKMPEIDAFKEIKNCTVDDIEDQIFEGEDVMPDVTVRDGERTLTRNKDYVLSYDDNWGRGEATVFITGAGSYIGKIEKKFNIRSLTIKDAENLTQKQWSLTFRRLGDSAVETKKQFKDGENAPPEFIRRYLSESGALDSYAGENGYKITTSALYKLAGNYFTCCDKKEIKDYMLKKGAQFYNKKTDTFTFYILDIEDVDYKLTSVKKTGTTYVLRGKYYARNKYEYDMQFEVKKTSAGYKIASYKKISPVVASQKKVSAYLYGYDDFKISWSSQKVSGAKVKYKVEYKKYGGNWSTLYKGTTATSAKKANLVDGVKYTFRVTPYATLKGKTYYGASESTPYIYTLKKLNTPSVEKSSESAVKVAWNNIDGETGYQIAKSAQKTKNFKVVKKVGKKYSSANLTASKNKTSYYKVRAYKTTKVSGKNITVYGPWSPVKSYKLK